MMPTSAGYYAQLSANHQRYLDDLAAWDCALEREIEVVTNEAKRGDEDVICAINEYLADNDEEQILHDLAFGSGAFDKLTEQRDRAIKYVAEKRLNSLKDEYEPD